jgi:hypothetical protein
MQIHNEDKIDKNKNSIFILSYMGMDYFSKWFDYARNTTDMQIIVVDNGSQMIPESLKECPIFQASQNLGCAGGWNLICNIAFNVYGMDKIIIGQDDAIFTNEMIANIWNNSNDNVIAGAYDRAFEFSLFGITKSFWETVGMFDENFIYVGCEDNDYKQRAKLLNKQVQCLNYSADMNISLTSKHITQVAKPANIYNVQYLEAKWGTHYEYIHPFNDSSKSVSDCDIYNGIVDVYGEVNKFPSLIEFETFQGRLQ